MPPLEYEENSNENQIFHLIFQEHEQWFHDFLERLFYSSEIDSSAELRKPVSFTQWLIKANRDDDLISETVEHLSSLYNDLLNRASILIEVSKETGKNPDYKQFKDIIALFEEFIIHLLRLEEEVQAQENGIDSFTGLRNKNMLVSDVSREMGRLARQGKSFCLALARIDRFDEISQIVDKSESDGYVKLMASLVKLSIRSFDDGYYMGEGVYALCLKQADITGGFRALERLRKELENQNVSVCLPDGQNKPLSMSCCIAEPVVGDEVEDLMNYLKKDLASSDMENADTVLKYRELSALERYAQKH